jgi:hypothetical protein
MTAPRIVHIDAVHCIGYWHNVAIVDIAGDLDPVRMRAVGEAYESLRQSYPQGMVAFVIAQPNSPVAGDKARAEGTLALKRLGDGLLQIFVVIEERGVLANLLRSVMRGINVVVRNSRMSVADTVEEAVHAAAKYIELPQPRAAVEQQLGEAVQAVRHTFACFPARVARENRQRLAARR